MTVAVIGFDMNFVKGVLSLLPCRYFRGRPVTYYLS
jgi:hypothetical protein